MSAWRLGLAAAVLALAALAWWLVRPLPSGPADGALPSGLADGALPSGLADGTLRLVFLDVGQGDAVLVVSPEGKTMLYDGGPKRGRAVEQLRGLGVRRLDLVVSSHGDADHIAAQEDVIRAFGAGAYIDSGLDKGTDTQAQLLESVRESGARLLEATDRTIELGSVRLRVVPPSREDPDDANANSVGLLIEYQGFRAWLSGDSEVAQTKYWMRRYPPDAGARPAPFERIDVYKSAHHGARGADDAAWLARVRPRVTVVSVGQDNRYGHPSAQVLALHRRLGASVFRTDTAGDVTVVVRSDGSYRVRPERGPELTSRAGERP